MSFIIIGLIPYEHSYLEANPMEFYNNKHSSICVWNNYAYYKRVFPNILGIVTDITQFGCNSS
jgi:hypothetical protein